MRDGHPNRRNEGIGPVSGDENGNHRLKRVKVV